LKVSVITPNFTIAGVPLAQVRFARALLHRGFEVDLVIGYIHPNYNFDVPRGINLVHLKKEKVRNMLFPLTRYLRTSRPDVVFCAEDHLNAVVLLSAILSRSSTRISGSSRVTPFDTYSSKPLTKGWLLKQIIKLIMWRAQVLTCVSIDMVKQYQQIFKSSKHVCVYNIVDDASSRIQMKEAVDHPWLSEQDVPTIIAAGRLAPWKGFDDLIRAVQIVSSRRPVKCLILGDGPLKTSLEALRDELQLQGIVEFPGYVQNPLKYFYKAKVFVLSSLVEGLPNVLVEAMMCGCTPVSTDCPTGPREVLKDGRYGYLVPVNKPVAMAAAIEQALDNPIASHLLEEAIKDFGEKVVIDRHLRLLGLCTS